MSMANVNCEMVKYKHQKSGFPSTIFKPKVIKPTFKCKKDVYFIALWYDLQ